MIFKTEKFIDYKKIYINNYSYFKEVDYIFKKYKIPYTIIFIESNIDIDLTNKLRYVDKYIKISNKQHIILLTHTALEQGYKSILRLEKNLFFNQKHIFTFGIAGIKNNYKNQNFESLDLLKNAIQNKEIL